MKRQDYSLVALTLASVAVKDVNAISFENVSEWFHLRISDLGFRIANLKAEL